MNKTALKFLTANALGSVETALLSYTGKPTKVDEVGHYMIKTVDSPSQKPVMKGTEIEIPMTEPNLDIVQCNRCFTMIQVQITLNLISGFGIGGQPGLPNLNQATAAQKELYKRIFIFVGFKHSADAICRYRLTLNGRDVSRSNQDKAMLESFLYHRVKPDCELQNRTGTYSLWEDVEAYETSICGRYVSLYELADTFTNGHTTMTLIFDLIIPFDATCLLQSHLLNPSCAFGHLAQPIGLSADSLVLARVDPAISIDKCTRLRSSVIDGVDYQKIYMQIAHTITENSTSPRAMFHQIGSAIDLIANVTWTEANGNVSSVTYTNSTCKFLAPEIQANIVRSNIEGYKVSPELRSFLKEYFTKYPFVVQAERVDFHNFPNCPGPTGIDTQVNVTLHHCTEIAVIFPHSPTERTCFLNPKLHDAHIRTMGVNLPERGVNTTDPAFFRQQLQHAQLDTILQCSNSFENSYTLDFSGKPNERYYTYTDITDFAFSVPTERPSSNAVFSEGLTSHENTVIAFSGQAIKQGEEEVYCNISRGPNPVQNITPPILALVQDSFLVFSARDGGVAVHETTRSWNEFLKGFVSPEAYQELLAMSRR